MRRQSSRTALPGRRSGPTSDPGRTRRLHAIAVDDHPRDNRCRAREHVRVSIGMHVAACGHDLTERLARRAERRLHDHRTCDARQVDSALVAEVSGLADDRAVPETGLAKNAGAVPKDALSGVPEGGEVTPSKAPDEFSRNTRWLPLDAMAATPPMVPAQQSAAPVWPTPQFGEPTCTAVMPVAARWNTRSCPEIVDTANCERPFDAALPLTIMYPPEPISREPPTTLGALKRVGRRSPRPSPFQSPSTATADPEASGRTLGSCCPPRYGRPGRGAWRP